MNKSHVLLVTLYLLIVGCESRKDQNAMEENFGDHSGLITVNCDKYGERTVRYNPKNSQYMADELLEHWKRYWPGIQETYESMIGGSGTPEYGTLEMLKGDWEFYVFDAFSDSDPMLEGHIILSLAFLGYGEDFVPTWDVHLEYGKVIHYQPVF